MLQIFYAYRRIVDQLDNESHQFTVDNFQSSDCFVLSLYRSMLDYSLAIDSSFRCKYYIMLPVALRSMAEAYGNLESLCRVEGFGSSYEYRGAWQRELDIRSFIKFMDDNPKSFLYLKSMYDDEKKYLEKLRPFVAAQKKKGIKIVSGKKLFATKASEEILHTAYRMSNSFLHNDMYGIERRNWKQIGNEKVVLSSRDNLSGVMLSCLFYSIKILSNSCKELERIYDWFTYPKNLDSRIQSFIVRMDGYANVS